MNRNVAIQSVKKLKGKTEHSYSYLVTTAKEANLSNIRKEVQDIQHLKIKWEQYAKERNYTQRFKCQRFGHSQINCNYAPKCVKCAQNHLTKDCILVKTETSKPKCANCRGEHTANFSSCPTLIDYLNEKQKTQNNKQNKTQQITQPRPISIASVVQPGLTYSSAVAGKRNNPFNTNSNELNPFLELQSEIKEPNKLVNISEILQNIRELNEKLRRATEPEERKLITLQHLLGFNG